MVELECQSDFIQSKDIVQSHTIQSSLETIEVLKQQVKCLQAAVEEQEAH